MITAARNQTNEKLKDVIHVIRCIENAVHGKIKSLSSVRDVCESERSLLNTVCRICGEKFHYCSSCGNEWEYPWLCLGYCSEDCSFKDFGENHDWWY